MHTLSINETKITVKNPLHGDNFVTEGNHESNNDKKYLVLGISADS